MLCIDMYVWLLYVPFINQNIEAVDGSPEYPQRDTVPSSSRYITIYYVHIYMFFMKITLT